MTSGPASFGAYLVHGSAAASLDSQADITSFIPGQIWYKGFFYQATRTSGSAIDTITEKVRWWDASGTELAATSNVINLDATVGWTWYEAEHLAPANAVRGRLNFTITPGSSVTQHDIWITGIRFAKTQFNSTLGADWTSNVQNRPSNLAALVGTEAINNQIILNSIAADSVLSVNEKLTSLRKLYTDLEARYNDLFNRATNLGLSTTALSTARTNWQNLLASWGKENVINGNFPNDASSWTAGNGASLSAVGGHLRITAPGSIFGPDAYQAITGLIIGQSYIVTAQLFAGTAGSQQLRVGTSAAGTQYGSSSSLTPSVTFTATATTAYVTVIINATPAAGLYIEADAISLKENPAQVLWDDPSADTTIYPADLLSGVSFPSGWATSGTGATSSGGPYTVISDQDAVNLFYLQSPVMAITVGATVAVGWLIDKDSIPNTTRAPGLYVFTNNGTFASCIASINTQTGAIVGSNFNNTEVLDLGDEWFVVGEFVPGSTCTQVLARCYPAYCTTNVFSSNGALTGSVSVRAPLITQGSTAKLGRPMLLGRLNAYTSAMTTLARQISEAQPVFRGPWVTATFYAVNDVVTSGNTLYECIVAHTSTTGPPNGNWTKYTPANQDDLTDGSTYVRIPGSNTFGSGTTRRAKIDFTDAHSNKNLDNVADGATYGSLPLANIVGTGTSKRALIDFSQGHANKNLDNVADGATYGSLPLANIVGTGTSKRALIDFSQGHANKNLDNVADGATYGSLPLANIAGTGTSKRALIDFSQAHVNKSLANVDSAANTKLGTIATGATVGADWGTNLTGRPANVAALAGTEAIKNNQLTINGSGQITYDGTNTVAATVVDNSKITLSSAGALQNAGGGSITALDFANVAGATKPANNATVGATWGTNLSSIPSNLAALVGTEAINNQLILNSIAADNVLSATEKLDFARLYSDLEARYTDLKNRATNLGLSTTTLSTARTNWQNLLATYSPAWNDTSQDTTIYNNTLLASTAFPGGWSLVGGGSSAANAPYTTLTDSDAANASYYTKSGITVLANTTYALGWIVDKDAVANTTRSPAFYLFTNGTFHSAIMSLDTSTGISNGTSFNNITILDLGDEWFIGGEFTTGSDNTAISLRVYPAYCTTNVFSSSATLTGSINVRAPYFAQGSVSALGRAVLRGRMMVYSSAMTTLARQISEAQPNFRGAWVTATAYAVNDVVTSGTTLYECTTAHTSTTAPPNSNWLKYTPANQDDLVDGATYGSLPLANIAGSGTSKRALIDFTQAHTNKTVDNVADGSTYARTLASSLSGNKPAVQVIGSGVTVGDQRNLPPINAANLHYTFTGAITYTTTLTSITMSVGAGTLYIGSTTISYNSMSVTVSSLVSGSTHTFYLYVQANAYVGGAHTLLSTETNTVVYNNDNNVYIGTVGPVTLQSSGSGGGSGGGGSCPWEGAYVETNEGWISAKDVKPGQLVHVLNDDRSSLTWEPVQSNEPRLEMCYTIRSLVSGYEVTVSDSTPITLRDGSLILVVDIDHHELPILVDDHIWWEPCVIEAKSLLPVAHIKCNMKTYNAGDKPGRGVLTHNPKP